MFKTFKGVDTNKEAFNKKGQSLEITKSEWREMF